MTAASMRTRRRKSIRRKISGHADRPRLAVYRSNRHIYAQLVDDVKGETLTAASSRDPEISGPNTKETAAEVGKLVAKRAKEAGVTTVVFDRGGYLYHGKVKALADGAREEGLVF